MQLQTSSSGTVFVAGLSWDISLTGALKAAQLAARGKKFKANAYSRFQGIEGSREALYGFGNIPKKALARAKAKKAPAPLVSLAGFAAAARPPGESFVLVAPFGKSSLAVAGVLGGRPVLDIEGPVDKVSAELAEFLQVNQIGALYYLETLGKPPVEVEGLEFVSLCGERESESALRLAAVEKLPKEAIGVAGLVLVFVTLGAAGGGFLIWKHNEEQKQLALAAQQQMSPQQIYDQSKKSALAAMPQLVAQDAGTQASDLFLALPTSVNGWRLSGGACRAQLSEMQCEAYWSPIAKNSTYAEFSGAWAGPSAYSTTLSKVVTPLTPAEPTQALRKVELSELPGMQEFLRHSGSFFQAVKPLNFKTFVGEPSLVGGPSTPKVAGMLYQANWALEGKVGLMRKMFEALPSNMALSSLEFQVPENSKQPISFKATGIVYVKNL